MHRIDTANAVAGLYVEAAGTQPRTLTSEAWGNAVQEEVASFIEAEGITLDPFVLTQLRSAILSRIASAVISTGLLGDFQTFRAPEDMDAGDAFFLRGQGDQGVLIVAQATVLEDVSHLFRMKGNVVLPKRDPGSQFLIGQVVYWDWSVGPECFDAAGPTRRIIGYSRTVENFNDPTVEVALNGTADSDPP